MFYCKPLYPILLGVVLLFSQVGLGQDRVVSGTVTDTAGNGVRAVTVSSKNSRIATQTNSTGAYTLSVPASVGSLIFTSIGFQTRELPIPPGNVLNVSLTGFGTSLNEIVVTGYGTTRKKDLTGAVTNITTKDFQKGVITTPEQLIAGKVAGVSVTSNDGRPGAGSTIRIRGGSSLTASNDPLIVIDGVPLENTAIAGSSNALSFINPNDIESFSVLKDASATAIYGTRASNGVILITTKKGSSAKLRVSFTTTNSASNITKKVDVLSPQQFRAVVNDKGTAAQKAALGATNTDWQNQIYQTGITTDNNISLSGGIKSLPYRLSLGYMDQTGVLKTDRLQRTSASLSLNPTLFDDHLKVNLNVKGSLEKSRFANNAAIGSAISFDPTQPVYSPIKDNRFGGYFEWRDTTSATGLQQLVSRNPLGLLQQRYDESTPKRSIGSLQLDYKLHFFPDLHANLNAGYDISEGAGTINVSDSAASDYVAGGTGGQHNSYKTSIKNSVFEFYLNYVKDITSINSRIDAVAGYSYNHYLTTTYNYPSYYASGTKVTGSDPAFPTNPQEHNLVSFFGRVNYTFKDKYLLTATVRRDGSSKFGPDFKWSTFPSIALAWKAKDESFLRNSKTVSELKVRVGYGITGQQDIGPNYAYLSVYGLSAPNASYEFGSNYYQMYRPGAYNPNLKWEQTTTYNFGIDYGLIDNRVTGAVDIYYKKTNDLLNNIPQPAGSNFAAFFIANVGSMENKGIEFSINVQSIRTHDVTLDFGFNITYNKNKITNLTPIPGDQNYRGIQVGGIAGGIGGGFAQIDAVGYSANTYNLYKQVYDASGKPLENVFVDKNSDGIINQDDLFKSKSATPSTFLGFTTNLNYKKWNAGFVLRANFGNYVYNNVYSNNGNQTQILGNYVLYNGSTNYLDTRFVGNSNNLLSDYFIQNASFLKMDYFNVGYNFGALGHGPVSLRLNATVQNVFVITNYKGLDPEISTGIDNNLYPRPRTFSLGLNLLF